MDKPCPSKYSGYDNLPLHCELEEGHIMDHQATINVERARPGEYGHGDVITWLSGDSFIKV